MRISDDLEVLMVEELGVNQPASNNEEIRDVEGV